MSKLFVFSIGGTGARVVRALTYLLASGVKLSGCEEVVPVIIDPDAQNADMNRTIDLLKTYKNIQDQLGTDCGFFATRINTLEGSFIFDFGGLNQKFKDFINLNGLDNDTQSLIRLLFTKDNLDSSLNIGFRGSPNVGSVVLNQLINSTAFKEFAANFNAGDKIFVISSIFGGTGAAGFPLLLKNLRRSDGGFANSEAIARAIVGSVTVLPYFRLADTDGSPIDSNTFITKTKAALSYYKDHLDEVNALYYIADEPDAPYPNEPGGTAQRNKAHFVELLSALAIVDFCYSNLEHTHREYFEYGLLDDSKVVTFEYLDKVTRSRLAKALIAFKYFARYFRDYLPQDTATDYYKRMELKNKLDSNPFYRDLERLLMDKDFGFFHWLDELGSNSRSFRPFELGSGDFNQLVRGKSIKTGLFSKGLSHSYFLERLIKNEKKNNEPDTEKKFIQLFHQVVHEAIEDKIPTI